MMIEFWQVVYICMCYPSAITPFCFPQIFLHTKFTPFNSNPWKSTWCLGHPHSLPDCNWTSRRQEEREDGTEELRHRPGRGLTAPDCRVVLGEEFLGVTWGWIVVTWFDGGGLFFSCIINYHHISISIVSICIDMFICIYIVYIHIYILYTYIGRYPFLT